MRVTKHHGLGNDFLVCLDGSPADGSTARAICDRRRGIGADGLILGVESAGGGVTMVLYNADGSRAEMSGNGIRCLAQAVVRARGTVEADLGIATDAGTKLVTVRPGSGADAGPNTLSATVDMGPVEPLAPSDLIERAGCDPGRPVATLDVGNPHLVVLTDDVAAVDLLAAGRRVPDVNLEIVEPGPEPDAITMRVHERGAGITEACGTGACAAAFAAHEWGLVGAEVTVHMPGGDAVVALKDGRAFLTGPATYVATIDWDGAP